MQLSDMPDVGRDNDTYGERRRGEGMSRVFRDILVTAEPEPDSYELMDCMEELEIISGEQGEDHQYTVFAQVFGHKESAAQFYLTGKILTPDQSIRIKAILSE